MTHIVLDLLLVLILGFCVWQGFRKGLILTVAGIVVLALAVWGASSIASRYADDFEERVHPLFGWVSDEAADDAMRSAGYSSGVRDEEFILNIAAGAFAKMGIVDQEAQKLADQVADDMRENSTTLKSAISNAFIHVICQVLLFVFTFAVIALLLTLLTHFFGMLVKLPGLKLFDTIGGLAVGLGYGVLLMFAIGWVLRFLGVIIPIPLIEDTTLLRFFVNNNPLAGLL